MLHEPYLQLSHEVQLWQDVQSSAPSVDATICRFCKQATRTWESGMLPLQLLQEWQSTQFLQLLLFPSDCAEPGSPDGPQPMIESGKCYKKRSKKQARNKIK